MTCRSCRHMAHPHLHFNGAVAGPPVFLEPPAAVQARVRSIACTHSLHGSAADLPEALGVTEYSSSRSTSYDDMPYQPMSTSLGWADIGSVLHPPGKAAEPEVSRPVGGSGFERPVFSWDMEMQLVGPSSPLTAAMPWDRPRSPPESSLANWIVESCSQDHTRPLTGAGPRLPGSCSVSTMASAGQGPDHVIDRQGHPRAPEPERGDASTMASAGQGPDHAIDRQGHPRAPEPEPGDAAPGPRMALEGRAPAMLAHADPDPVPVPDSAIPPHPAQLAERGASQICLNPAAPNPFEERMQQKHAKYLGLDDPEVQPLGPVLRWGVSLALAGLSSAVMSLLFPLVGSFRPAGCPGAPALETVCGNALLACSFASLSFLLMMYDPELCTVKWSLYTLLYCLVSLCGLKTLVEQATGARTDHVVLYYFVTPVLLMTFALPWPQAAARVAEDDGLDWPYPWRWSLQRFVARFPVSEALCTVSAICATGSIITVVWLDALFLKEAAGWRRWLGRPLLLLATRWAVVEVFQYGIAKSASPRVKFWGTQMYSLKVAAIVVRLIEACETWNQVGVILGLDFAVFLRRTVQFFCWGLPGWRGRMAGPAAPGPGGADAPPACSPRQWVRRALLGVSLAPRGANDAHYAAYHYMVRNSALSTMYGTAILGYLWLSLLGPSPARDALVATMFPQGRRSLLFLLAGLAVDLVQDVLAHAAVWYAMRRQPSPCSFSFMFPGMLVNTGRLWLVVRLAGLLSAYHAFTIHTSMWIGCV